MKKSMKQYPRKVELPMYVRCLKCGKVIDEAMSDDCPWESPENAVVFHGGLSFGSNLLDALVNGIMVKVIICDDCIKDALSIGRALKYRINKDEINNNNKAGSNA